MRFVLLAAACSVVLAGCAPVTSSGPATQSGDEQTDQLRVWLVRREYADEVEPVRSEIEENEVLHRREQCRGRAAGDVRVVFPCHEEVGGCDLPDHAGCDAAQQGTEMGRPSPVLIDCEDHARFLGQPRQLGPDPKILNEGLLAENVLACPNSVGDDGSAGVDMGSHIDDLHTSVFEQFLERVVDPRVRIVGIAQGDSLVAAAVEEPDDPDPCGGIRAQVLVGDPSAADERDAMVEVHVRYRKGNPQRVSERAA